MQTASERVIGLQQKVESVQQAEKKARDEAEQLRKSAAKTQGILDKFNMLGKEHAAAEDVWAQKVAEAEQRAR